MVGPGAVNRNADRAMQIFVRCPSGVSSVRTVEAGDSVEALKSALASESGVPAEEQRLVCGGRDLVCGRTLGACGVRADATVEVQLRLRGGAQLGKAVKGRSRDKKADNAADYDMMQDRIRRIKEYDMMQARARVQRARIHAMMAIEQKNTHINRLKIQNQWRKIMRLAKLEQLRKDIEILSQSHERDVDRKDAILQMLDRDLEEAEEQYQMAHRAHLQNVDKLIDIHDARLLALENEFEKDLSTLEDDFSAERAEIVEKHEQSCAELHNVMDAMETAQAERRAEAKQEHETLREEIRNKNLEDINVLRITLDSTIEDLEQHFETAHLHYLQTTDQRTTDFKHLTAQDHRLSEEIKVKTRKSERLTESILQWKAKITQNSREATERNARLQAEKDQISKHFQQLKGRLAKFRGGQDVRLSELTQTVAATRTKLQGLEKLGSSILRQGELARQLETEQEKVLPFYKSTVDEEGEAAEEEGAEGADTGGGAKLVKAVGGVVQGGESLDEWNYLNNFWKRYNKATLDNLAIGKEKERLEAENRDLQSILKQYIDGISVNESVMGSLNPLLVLNGRIHLNQPKVEAMGQQHVTVVEANHMVETGRAGAF